MIRSVRGGVSPLLLVLLLAGGCASTPPPGGAGAPLELSAWRPPSPQQCGFDRLEEPIAPHRVLDSARVATAAAAQQGPGSMLLSIAVDSLGAVKRFRIIESTFSQPGSVALLEQLRAAFRPDAVPAPFAARLLLEGGGSRPHRLRVGSHQECRPVLRNARAIADLIAGAAGGFPDGGQVRLDVFVTGTGRVAEARIQSSSGDGRLDQQLLFIAHRMEFHPALLDREPVPVWIRMPLSVRRR